MQQKFQLYLDNLWCGGLVILVVLFIAFAFWPCGIMFCTVMCVGGLVMLCSVFVKRKSLGCVALRLVFGNEWQAINEALTIVHVLNDELHTEEAQEVVIGGASE